MKCDSNVINLSWKWINKYGFNGNIMLYHVKSEIKSFKTDEYKTVEKLAADHS